MRGEWSGSFGDGGRGGGGGVDCGRVLPLPLVVDLVICGFRGEKTLGDRQKFSLCCYR